MSHPAASFSQMPQPTHAITVVVTTVDDEEQARCMARSVVELQLAACVQIEPVESLYCWDGVLQAHREWRISCKTTEAHLGDLWQSLLKMHPYAVPMLYVLPVAFVHLPYAQWVANATKSASSPPSTV